MSYLRQTYSKVKIEYILKVIFKDGNFKIFYGKTPYFDLKNFFLKEFNLNPYYDINEFFLSKFYETKISEILLKGVTFSNKHFNRIDVFEDYIFDEEEIKYDYEEILEKKYLNENTIDKIFSEIFLKEITNDKITNDSFFRFHEKKEKEYFGFYQNFIDSNEEFSNIYPSKLNLIETINFLKNKDIYDAVDFFSEEYFDELFRGYEESKMLYTEKDSNLKEQIELLKDLHRSTDAYKKWKEKQLQKKVNNSSYYNRSEDNYSDNSYRENHCPYCMESPCQCSDNPDLQ